MLLDAIRNNDSAQVQLELSNSADITEEMLGPLIVSNNDEIFNAIINYKLCDDSDRGELLVLAACADQTNRVKMLLDIGTDPNYESDDWGSLPPLGQAATFGYEETVKLLVMSGAKIYGGERFGREVNEDGYIKQSYEQPYLIDFLLEQPKEWLQELVTKQGGNLPSKFLEKYTAQEESSSSSARSKPRL